MKTVNEVLTKVKGPDKLSETITGRGAFSQSGFSDLVNAAANDTTYTIPTYNKNGEVTGEINLSELIRSDLKKTLEKAKYPQKSEAGVLDTCEICTTGLSKAIPHLVMEQLSCGRKFDLPAKEKVNGSIYLASVPGKVKETRVRDPKSQTALGSVVTTSKDWIQVRAKSKTPDHLQTKVRKDTNGKVIG